MVTKKIHPKYKTLLTDKSRYFIITGGRGSGKSYSAAWSILMLTFELNQSIFYTRKTMASAESSIIPDFKQVIEDWELNQAFSVTANKIVNLNTGSTITFMGLQTSSGENTAKAKGLSQATIWVLDEAEELTSESQFNKWDFSIRSKANPNKIIMIMNPATKEHFIYERFFQYPGVMPGTNGKKGKTTYIHTTYLDNIDNLDEDYIEQLEELKKRAPEQFEFVVLGGWREKAEGVIFTNWEIGNWRDTGNVFVGGDDGFNPDPFALVKVSIDNRNKKIYCQELAYHKQLIESEKVEMIRKKAGYHKIYFENASSIIEACLRRSVAIEKADKSAGSVLRGISFLQDYKLVIHPSSVNLVKELNNYHWSDRKSNTPVDRHNHLIDALRYAVSSQSGEPAWQPSVGARMRN